MKKIPIQPVIYFIWTSSMTTIFYNAYKENLKKSEFNKNYKNINFNPFSPYK